MININNPYIRRKEMDSVLTYMVESGVDPLIEFNRIFKKISETDSFRLINSVETALSLYLDTYKDSEKREIILSALSPNYLYNTVLEKGFTPVIVDVSSDSGYPEETVISEVSGTNTLCYINVHYFYYKPIESLDLEELPVLDLLLCGVVVNNGTIQLPENAIVTLGKGHLLSAMGGAILTSNSLVIDYVTEQLNLYEDKALSKLQVSILNSQLPDLMEFYQRIISYYELYTTAIMKSGYYTLVHDKPKGSGYFPVVVKKSLKDIQKYMRQQELESFNPFVGAIIRQLKDIKMPGARSLALRTFTIPLNMTVKKDHLELISRILSTLP